MMLVHFNVLAPVLIFFMAFKNHKICVILLIAFSSLSLGCFIMTSTAVFDLFSSHRFNIIVHMTCDNPTS